MHISCEIIRDILPLYAEDVVSDATKELVAGHLCACDACTKELENLKEPARIEEAGQELNSLNRIRRAIVLRRMLAVLAAVLLVLCTVCSVHCYLHGIIPMSAEEVDIQAEVTDAGTLMVFHKIYRNNSAHGFLWQGKDNYAYMSVLTRIEKLRSDGVEVGLMYTQNVKVEDAVNLWYVNPETGEADTLIWDAEKQTPAELEPGEDLDIHFSRYPRVFAAVFGSLAVVLSVLAWMYRKKSGGKWMYVGAVLCWCQLLSTVVNADAYFQNYNGMVLGEILHLLAMGLLFAVTVLCWHKVFSLTRQDRGA